MLMFTMPFLVNTVHGQALDRSWSVYCCLGCVLGNAGSDNRLERSNTNDERILKLYLQFDVGKLCVFL